jgi:hypothetical protein
LCQDLTGVDMLNSNVAELRGRILRALLFSALSSTGATCSIEDVGRAISSNLDAARDLVRDAWSASMPDPAMIQRLNVYQQQRKQTWTDAWAIAWEHHHLSEDQWLDMTPRQLATLRTLRLEKMQREELLTGIVASTIANFSFQKPLRPVKAEIFMLHKLPPDANDDDGADTGVTGEHIMAQMSKLRQRR